MLRFLVPATVALCLVASTAHADSAPVVFSGQVSAATDGMARGISETASRPQGILNLTLAQGPLYGGLLVKDVSTPEGANSQNDLYVGLRGPLAGFTVNAQAWLKDNVDPKPGTQHRFAEYQVDISRTFGATTAKVMVLHSPDFYAKTKESTWTEASLAQKLSPKWTVSAGYGHRAMTPKKDYNGWNLGAAYTVRAKTTLDVRYFDTDEHHFGKTYVSRLRVMLLQNF
jgi:uncharacterized protein (TIGR02001 family)